MDGDAVKQLAERFRQPMEIGGLLARPSDWVVVDPATVAAPTAKHIIVQSLGALRDYVRANRDGLDLGTVYVHVESPSAVWLGGPLRDRTRDREFFAVSKAMDMTEGFVGKFMAIEEFIIGLQARFVESDDRQRVLQLLGTVKQETAKTAMDDGITQTVTARAGVALVSEVKVPNPVTLSPWRTFREVTQPQSAYVLRVKGGGTNSFPEVGLFEADGGAWRLVAVGRVRDWLVEHLPEGVAVLA